MLSFDHIEVHVKNSLRYCHFLKSLFKGGRYKKISENETYMFLSQDNLRIEVKQNNKFNTYFQVENGIGFCLPCLRMKNAKIHLNEFSEIEIVKEIINPDGAVIFFKDFEGIDWHIKDYEVLDIYVNI